MYYIEKAGQLLSTVESADSTIESSQGEPMTVDQDDIDIDMLSDFSFLPPPSEDMLISDAEDNKQPETHISSNESLENILTAVDSIIYPPQVPSRRHRTVVSMFQTGNSSQTTFSPAIPEATSETKPTSSHSVSQKIETFFKRLKPSSKVAVRRAESIDETVGEYLNRVPPFPTTMSKYSTFSQMGNLKRLKLLNRVKPTSGYEKGSINPSDVWVHTPTQLENGSILAESQFIGMYPVKNIMIMGRGSVQGCIEKAKVKSAGFCKLAQVYVTVSTKEINIINYSTKSQICAHKMQSVFCCSQDTADQRVFCYAYQEEANKKFLCNIFRCNTVKVCSEIVLAIGLAFSLITEKRSSVENV